MRLSSAMPDEPRSARRRSVAAAQERDRGAARGCRLREPPRPGGADVDEQVGDPSRTRPARTGSGPARAPTTRTLADAHHAAGRRRRRRGCPAARRAGTRRARCSARRARPRPGARPTPGGGASRPSRGTAATRLPCTSVVTSPWGLERRTDVRRDAGLVARSPRQVDQRLQMLDDAIHGRRRACGPRPARHAARSPGRRPRPPRVRGPGARSQRRAGRRSPRANGRSAWGWSAAPCGRRSSGAAPRRSRRP